MDALIQAVAKVLASFLETLGVIGRARRRAGIHADLALLREMEAFPQFSQDTWSHTLLTGRIEEEIATLSGVSLRPRRNIAWASVVIALIICAGLSYATFALSDIAWWYAIPTGFLAAVMFIAVVGLLNPQPETPSDATGTNPALSP